MNEKNVILHCHIFKNAGTTLDWALERNFGSGFYDHRDDADMRRNGMSYLHNFIESKPGLKAISSHHMPFMPEDTGKYWWLILLREPFRRVRSVYEYEVKQPVSSLGSRMAKKMNFSEYIQWRMQDDVPAVVKNFYVRYLNNIELPDRVIGESFIDKALSRLKLDKVLVGSVERFDESMVIFEEALKQDFPDIDLSYIKQNVSRKDTEATLEFIDSITPEAKDALLNNNQLDNMLYGQVNDELQRLIVNLPDMNSKLCDFRDRCNSLVEKDG